MSAPGFLTTSCDHFFIAEGETVLCDYPLGHQSTLHEGAWLTKGQRIWWDAAAKPLADGLFQSHIVQSPRQATA